VREHLKPGSSEDPGNTLLEKQCKREVSRVMETRGLAAVCKGLPSTGDPNLRGYESLFAPHHWHRNCATFSTSKRLFEISPTKIFRHRCISTRAPTTGAHHPRQQALAPECSTGISPEPSRNLPRYPDLGVATTIVDRNNFCRPTGSNNCCWQRHVRHETKTTTHIQCHRYCERGGA
jgi:hypothetical protein